jgi:alpha-galactosidase
MDKLDGSRYKAEGNAGRRIGVYPMHIADANQFAAWGFDYLKYDWGPIDVPHAEAMSDALKATGRDIVYSLSNTADFKQIDEWKRIANVWRTTGDIIDTWGSVSDIGFTQNRWSKYSGPGNWNDPDMLVVGKLGWGANLHPTRISPNEQYSHISLWCLLSAPLLLGCDLTQLDDFTLNLITNDEVLEVNQDPLGKQAQLVYEQDFIQVWVKVLENGSHAVGVFNLSDVDKKDVRIPLAKLGLNNQVKVRDLWRQKDLGTASNDLVIKEVPIHGCSLFGVR